MVPEMAVSSDENSNYLLNLNLYLYPDQPAYWLSEHLFVSRIFPYACPHQFYYSVSVYYMYTSSDDSNFFQK